MPKLRVWWIFNPPHEPERYLVSSIGQAKCLIQELTKRDLVDKSITSNAGGVEVFEDDEWTEFYDDEGNDIFEIIDGG